MLSSVFMRIPDWLFDEISLRMDEKLSIIKVTPEKIWQRGSDAGVLSKRYAKANIFVSEKKDLYPLDRKSVV